jgi:hypothetical protein
MDKDRIEIENLAMDKYRKSIQEFLADKLKLDSHSNGAKSPISQQQEKEILWIAREQFRGVKACRCLACGKEVKNGSLANHIKSHLKTTNNLKCFVCGTEYQTDSLYRNHILKDHSKKRKLKNKQ